MFAVYVETHYTKKQRHVAGSLALVVCANTGVEIRSIYAEECDSLNLLDGLCMVWCVRNGNVRRETDRSGLYDTTETDRLI